MRAVIQRVSRAEVRVEGQTVAAIGRGLVILVAVEKGDTHETVAKAAERFASLRVFEDQEGKMNLPLAEVQGGVLLVSNFTVAGSTARGRRPSFDNAAAPQEARLLFEALELALRNQGIPVATGVFGAHMEVALVNDGPVTLIWESKPATV